MPDQPAPAPAPQRRSGCLWVFVILLVAALGISVMANFGLATMASGVVADQLPLTEKHVSGEGTDKIALITIEGVIMDVDAGSIFGKDKRLVDEFRKELKAAEDDPFVKAVVLRINSPGGAVSTSDQMWNLLKQFRERSNKPVVVSMGGVCASGGYYIAAAADRLVAEPTTITGSIGVIMATFNMSGISGQFGFRQVVIKSGANKDLLNPFQEINEEHIQIVQSTIDSMYNRFLAVITEGREDVGLAGEHLRDVADGRIYTAEQALANKLVDVIGYRDEAIAQAQKLAKIDSARVIRYKSAPGLLDMLAGAQATPVNDLVAEFKAMRTPQLMVLWTGQ